MLDKKKRDHANKGQSGGCGTFAGRHRKSRHHYIRMDGLLLVLRVHVEYGVVCERQVVGAQWSHVSRQGLVAHTGHRGSRVQGGQG